MTANADRYEETSVSHPTEKKVWEKPAIVIERSLVAQAQEGIEPEPLPPFLGGLLGSGVGG
jgi:hypothetical protein